MFLKKILSRIVKSRLIPGELDFERLAEDLSTDYFNSFLADCDSCPAARLSLNDCKDYE